MKLFTLKERERLLNDELKRIIDVIKNEYDPERIILFGSMATNKIHEWSDIDLLIVNKRKLPFEDLRANGGPEAICSRR